MSETENARVMLRLTEDEAVTLFDLVARSHFANGLGNLYAELGDAVRDENGLVPGNPDYVGPAPRRVAALTLPVRLLSRLVGRGVAHSSKNDEMRARAEAS